jgi:FdhD protein
MSDLATYPVTVQRISLPDGVMSAQDVTASEEPLEIRVEGRSVAVVMRTPGHDEELVAGFLVSEGVVKNARDILEISQCPSTGNTHGNVVDVLLGGAVVNWENLTRHVFSASSCGICGKTSIESVFMSFPPLSSGGALGVEVGGSSQCLVVSDQSSETKHLSLTTKYSAPAFTISPELLTTLPAKLRAAQETFSQTGGLHASAIFDEHGEMLVLREDVGRHNALDKVLGHGLKADRLPYSRHILLVSGRVSFELMQKALAAGVPIVAAISAPSSLAVQFAESSGQTLVGFLRGQTMNVYTHPERIL